MRVYISKEKASVQSYILTNARNLHKDEEELARNAGWKEFPDCGYIMKGKDRKLYCTYKYDSERILLSKAISLGEAYEDDASVVKECSVKFCPFKLHLGV